MLYIDARNTRCGCIAANQIYMPSKHSLVENECNDEHDANQIIAQQRNAAEAAGCYVDEAFREIDDWVAARENQRETASDTHRAKGDDERRQAAVGNADAVAKTDYTASQQRHDDRNNQRIFTRMCEHCGTYACYTDDRTHRKINAARDDDNHHAHC